MNGHEYSNPDNAKPVQLICPVEHLKNPLGEKTELEFDPNVFLRVSGEYKEKLSENYQNCLFIDVKNNEQDQAINLASRVITSFRLCAEGRIGYSVAFVPNDNLSTIDDLYGAPSRIPKNMRDSNSKLCRDYDVSNNTLDEVKGIYSKITAIIDKEIQGEESILILALSRFNRSYNEENAEDILLDLMICLEILLVTEKRQKRLQLALLSAYLLKGKTEDDWSTIQLILKRAYKIRGEIVHDGKRYIKNGGKPTIGVPGVREFSRICFLEKVKNYARYCLREYIERLFYEKNSGNNLRSNDLRRNIVESYNILEES